MTAVLSTRGNGTAVGLPEAPMLLADKFISLVLGLEETKKFIQVPVSCWY